MAHFSVDADHPLVIAEGLAEPVGDIRVQLANPTLAKAITIEVALSAPLLDERPARLEEIPSTEAILPDGSRVAGKYTSSHTIRFDHLDGIAAGRGPIVISGLRVACVILGIAAAGNTIEIKATIRLLPDLESRFTYFSSSPDVVVARSQFSMTSEIVGVAEDSFTPGQPTVLTRFAPLPLRQHIRTDREDLFIVGAVRIREISGGLFRTRLDGEDSGTRFIVRISYIPKGVEVFLSATDVDITGVGSAPSIVLVAHTSSSQSSGDTLEIGHTTKASTLRDVGFHLIPLDHRGEVEAVYEFVGQRSEEGGDGHRFDVVAAIRGQPIQIGHCTATVRLGPKDHYSGQKPPVPRYVDASGCPEGLFSTLREPIDHWVTFILKSIDSENVDWPTLFNEWTTELYWCYEGTELQPAVENLGAAIQAKDVGRVREALQQLLLDPPPF